jgi:hypothetical protein
VQTILYERAQNPDTRVIPDKTRNVEYYTGILCKTDHLSEKSSTTVHRTFLLCNQISFKKGFEQFIGKKLEHVVFHQRIIIGFNMNYLKRISTLRDKAKRFSYRNYNLKPIDLFGAFALFRVNNRSWRTNFSAMVRTPFIG